MIGLDTNILARYYIQDDSDAEALKQHEAARKLLESGKPLMVCKTVLLELEWVMRGYYGFEATEIAAVMYHLLSLPRNQSRGQPQKAIKPRNKRSQGATAARHRPESYTYGM